MRPVLLVVALVATTCQTTIATPSPSLVPTPTETITASPTVAPTPTPTVVLTATASAQSSLQPATLSVMPLGKLSGKIAWVVNVTAQQNRGGDIPPLAALELWAIPLDGSAPRRAAQYASTQLGGFGNDTNVLRRQFSPDGRRLVLSVALDGNARRHALVLIDLETAAVKQLIANTDADFINPAWSPDGTKIAFLRSSGVLSTEIWVMNADGTSARRLRPASLGTTTPIFGWAADSGHIGFAPIWFERGAYALLDLNGVITSEAPGNVSPTSRDPADWRGKSPAFVLSFQDPSPMPSRSDVIVGDDPAQKSPRILADVVTNPNDNTVVGMRDPRWDPSGADRVLFIQTGVQGSFVVATLTGGTQQGGGRVNKAEWLSDGSGIVTLEEHPSTAPLSVFQYDPTGKPLSAPAIFLKKNDTNYRLIDLAARVY